MRKKRWNYILETIKISDDPDTVSCGTGAGVGREVLAGAKKEDTQIANYKQTG